MPVGEEATLTLVAGDGQGHQARTELRATVTWAGVVSVEFDPVEQVVNPGEVIGARVTLVSHDTLPHQVQLQTYFDQEVMFDYSAPLYERTVLEPGEKKWYDLMMRPRLGALAGEQGRVVVEARLSDLAGQVAGAETVAIVAEKFGLALKAVPDVRKPDWGETISYALWVTNTGSLPGGVKFELSAGPDHYPAGLKLPEGGLALSPGQSAQVELEVEPVFAGLGEFLARVRG